MVTLVPLMLCTGVKRSVNEFWASSSIRFCSGRLAIQFRFEFWIVRPVLVNATSVRAMESAARGASEPSM
jgi:hypothetical protein